MWARVKLKVDWSDILYTTIAGMRGGDVDLLQRDLETFWSPKGDAIACFSVRSGFDLLLQACNKRSNPLRTEKHAIASPLGDQNVSKSRCSKSTSPPRIPAMVV